MNGKESAIFLDEAALADSFYQACLFYAYCPSKATGTPQKPLARFPDFVKYVDELRELEQSWVTRGVPKIAARRAIDQLARETYYDHCSDIHTLYFEGIKALSRRVRRVAREYRKRIWWVKWLGNRVADRNDKFAKAQRRLARISCEDLLRVIKDNLSKIDPQIVISVSKLYTTEWRVLRESGSVFMAEITYLSQRVDDFNAYFNTRVGQFLAIIGLIFTVFSIRACSSGTSIRSIDSPKKQALILNNLKVSETRQTSKDEEVLEKISSNLEKILATVAAHGGDETHPSEDGVATLSQQLKQIYLEVKNISDTVKMSTRDEQALAIHQSEITTLNGELFKLIAASDSRISPMTPSQVDGLLGKLAGIEDSIRHLANTAKKEETPPAKVEIHAWGLGVVRSVPQSSPAAIKSVDH